VAIHKDCCFIIPVVTLDDEGELEAILIDVGGQIGDVSIVLTDITGVVNDLVDGNENQVAALFRKIFEHHTADSF
jgi:hypothetical protein